MAVRTTDGVEIRVVSAGGEERVTVADAPAPSLAITLPRDTRRVFADLRLQLGTDGADLVIENGDLALEEGLATATIVSLFSDARAPLDEALPAGESRRGFWGEDAGDPFGSLLWLVLDREKVTPSVIERMRGYAAQALQWLVDEDVAERVEVQAVRSERDRVDLQVVLHRGSARRWQRIWAGTAADPLLVSGLRVQILTL